VAVVFVESETMGCTVVENVVDELFVCFELVPVVDSEAAGLVVVVVEVEANEVNAVIIVEVVNVK